MSARYPARKLSPRQAAKVAEFNQRLASGEFARAHYPCAACGQDDPEPLFANDRYGIAQATVICRRCGLLYLDPRPTREEQDRFYNGDAYRLLYEPEAQGAADLVKPYQASFAAAR